jgi:hypothetical protein
MLTWYHVYSGNKILLTNTVDFTHESFIYHQNAALLFLVE